MISGISILKSMKLFEGLGPLELISIADLMQPMNVKEGEVITKAGAPANAFYVVLTGHYMVAFPGGQAFTLHNAGDFIGWAILTMSPTYTGTSTALTDGTVLFMRADDFLRLLRKNLALGDKIMKTVRTQKESLRYGFSFERNI